MALSGLQPKMTCTRGGESCALTYSWLNWPNLIRPGRAQLCALPHRVAGHCLAKWI